MSDLKLFQLIYVSRATVEFSQEDLRELLENARVNNHKLGIGGLLIFEDGDFIQVLEGPKEEVLELFDKIKRDHRHTEVKKLFLQKTDKKEFGEWEMGFLRPKKDIPLAEGYKDIRTIGDDGDDPTTVKKALVGFLEGRWRLEVK